MNNNSNKTSPKWSSLIAYLPLLAGVGIAVYALLAPMGVWLGWWDFRKGFQVLGQANTYAPWLAGGCVVVGITAVILSLKFSSGQVMRSGILAAVGVVFALTAYFVPQSYRPPEGTPPIHDISTDTANPPEFVAVLPLRADSDNTVIYGGSPDMTPEKLAQLQTDFYPDIKPVRLSLPREEVFAKVLAAVEEMGWDLVAQVPEEGRIEATDTSFWFRFKDDIVIKIHTEGDETVVNARSISRVGVSDVGANAKRLREFFERLTS